MKQRVFYAFLVVMFHLSEAGLPASFHDVIGLLIVALRAWNAGGRREPRVQHRLDEGQAVTRQPRR